MQIQGRAWLLVFLVATSYCSQRVEASATLNKARTRWDKVRASLGVATSPRSATHKPITLGSEINAVGLKIAGPAVVPVVVLLLFGFSLSQKLFQLARDPAQNVISTKDTTTVAVTVGLVLALTAGVYLRFLRPAGDCQGADCAQSRPFRAAHDVALLVHVLIMMAAVYVVRRPVDSNSAALVLTVFSQGTLVMGIAIQLFLALCLGEWGMGATDFALASAQDNLPGTVLASLLSVPSFSSMVVEEALVHDANASFTTRFLRFFVILIAASAHLLNVQSPLETDGVASKTVKHWRTGHKFASSIGFIALAVYLLLVNQSNKTPAVKAVCAVVIGLAALAMSTNAWGKRAGLSGETSAILSAISQYTITAIAPLTLFNRFTFNDMDVLQKQVQTVYTEGQPQPVPLEPSTTNLVGNKMLLPLLPALLWFLLSGGLLLATTLHWAKPNGSQKSWAKTLGLALVALAAIASGALYFARLRPRGCDASSEDCSQAGQFATILDSALAVFWIGLLGVGFALRLPVNNNTPALVATFFGTFTLIASLTVQTFVAMSLREWGALVQDATISTTQDNIPGAKLASWVTLPSMLALVFGEALFQDSKHSTWVQLLRFLLILVAGAGFVGVVHAPLETEGVGNKTVSAWQATHFPAAAACFGATALYMLVVAMTSHTGHMSLVGAAVVVLAMALLSLKVLGGPIGMAPELSQELFALGEYVMVAAAPIVLLSRFSTSDTRTMRNLMLKIQEHGLFPKHVETLGSTDSL